MKSNCHILQSLKSMAIIEFSSSTKTHTETKTQNVLVTITLKSMHTKSIEKWSFEKLNTNTFLNKFCYR